MLNVSIGCGLYWAAAIFISVCKSDVMQLSVPNWTHSMLCCPKRQFILTAVCLKTFSRLRVERPNMAVSWRWSATAYRLNVANQKLPIRCDGLERWNVCAFERKCRIYLNACIKSRTAHSLTRRECLSVCLSVCHACFGYHNTAVVLITAVKRSVRLLVLPSTRICADLHFTNSSALIARRESECIVQSFRSELHTALT